MWVNGRGYGWLARLEVGFRAVDGQKPSLAERRAPLVARRRQKGSATTWSSTQIVHAESKKSWHRSSK